MTVSRRQNAAESADTADSQKGRAVSSMKGLLYYARSLDSISAAKQSHGWSEN